MKFFSKYKKQIFSVFLCVALFSCFIGFSFSSSADVVNEVSELTLDYPYFQSVSGLGLNSTYPFSEIGNGWYFNTALPYDQVTPIFKRLSFQFSQDYSVPAYSGRPLSLSVNLDFTVSDHGYLSLVPDGVDLSDSAIFTSAYVVLFFSDGSLVTISADTFILKDEELGEIVDPSSDAYWETRRTASPWNFSIYALFDVSPYVDKTITSTYFSFPNSACEVYYSNDNLNGFLTITDISAFYDFAYSPFQDVVQDDLSDIKGSLSGVNNKLDSLNSTMNTIDQDINRVDQKLEQTNETLGNIDQGIQDILKPSTPAVDFKNQWNDYFANNNPIPDMSALPFYDITSIQTLLIDSSDIVRGIFSPFFLREYVVRIPLTQGFANVELDPVATYVSLSVALSISFIMFRLLKGSRG